MGNYIRVFCKSDEKPSVKKMIDYINSKIDEFVWTNLNNKEIETEKWKHFELYYNKEKSPILIEINEVGNSNGLAEEELIEFKEFIGKPKFLETKKRKVIKHLSKTKFIICNQLLSDIDDEGYNVLRFVLGFFTVNFEGIHQVDGEGIYIDEKYLIKTE